MFMEPVAAPSPKLKSIEHATVVEPPPLRPYCRANG